METKVWQQLQHDITVLQVQETSADIGVFRESNSSFISQPKELLVSLIPAREVSFNALHSAVVHSELSPPS
jgi:hypothetical protein